MIGVVNSIGFDILDFHGEAFAKYAPELVLLRPEEVADPAAVEFVLTFRPPDDCFAPYPNLKAAISSAAGVDGILACPSLPQGLPVMRVEDPDQARQMAGFAVFHVLWHHRRMDLHLEDQAAERWNRPAHGRSPENRRIGIMGYGNMGRAIAAALAGLGYPVGVLARRPIAAGRDPAAGLSGAARGAAEEDRQYRSRGAGRGDGTGGLGPGEGGADPRHDAAPDRLCAEEARHRSPEILTSFRGDSPPRSQVERPGIRPGRSSFATALHPPSPPRGCSLQPPLSRLSQCRRIVPYATP